ncbi:MAG: right-handed parallel beta-helix repeat-containing protein, partial [Deltaproteobacteria bacterium]|nr:right-handed parallel beta-helix repeat-containing protein [Deltaproteobacteria bacterium]
DILLVSGTCNENIVIRDDVLRIPLDGQGTATISGPDATLDTIDVRGRGITIRGFNVTGGRDGIRIFRGGTAANIDGNSIQSTGRNGISVSRNSSASITNNTECQCWDRAVSFDGTCINATTP